MPTHRPRMPAALAPTLAAAGRDPAGVIAVEIAVETQSGGISGAATLRVTFAEGTLACKLTRASCADDVWQRAVREWHFYQQWRSLQPLRTPRLLASVCDQHSLGLALAGWLGCPVDPSALCRAAAALETRGGLLAWPAYLRGASAERLAIVVERLTELAAEW